MAGWLRTIQNWMALPCTTNAKLGPFAIQECLFIVGLMPWSKEMSEDPRERADAEKAMKCKILLRTCGHVENVYLKITEHQSPVQVKSLQQQSSKWLKRTGWQEWMSTLIFLHKAQRGDLGKKSRKPQLSKRTLSSVSNGWWQNWVPAEAPHPSHGAYLGCTKWDLWLSGGQWFLDFTTSYLPRNNRESVHGKKLEPQIVV